jgi:hypothetical protein
MLPQTILDDYTDIGNVITKRYKRGKYEIMIFDNEGCEIWAVAKNKREAIRKHRECIEYAEDCSRKIKR